jgi:cell division protein YceG involved in septum cleavage
MKTMRTILRATMIFALIAFANVLMAAKALNVEIQTLAANDAVLAITSPSDSNLKITVEDKNGKMVYYKEIAGEGVYYRQFVNFSNLKKGQYKLSVVSNGLTSERLFKISNKAIKVINEEDLWKN